MLGAQAQQQAGPGTVAQQAIPDAPRAQQAIPDAPKPQTTLPAAGSIAPGKGTSSTSGGDETPGDAASAPVAPAAAQAADPADNQPAVPTESRDAFTMTVRVNRVEVPFTVKDSKNHLVAGLTSRDVRVYENGVYQPITDFVVDPYPLSVALVIDQSMTHDDMTRVNQSLSALPAAFSIYDEISVFTYNNGPRMITDFTAAQSARLTQAIEKSKSSGRDALLAGALDGPIAQGPVVNGQNFDPNTSANRGHSTMQINAPRDVHTLNDAILAAATALSKAAPGRRRVIYVISNGNEYGSEAKLKDVIKYLQRNSIEVDGTLVGDSSLPVIGFLNRIHLPLTMRDNVLVAYKDATGGNFDSEFRTGEIERSFARIALEARQRYVLAYFTHEPVIDGKYRKIEVKVLRENLTVLAEQGYWPTATDVMPSRPVVPAAK
jgi:VWFA-related protein